MENELLPWHRRRWLGWEFACDWYVIGPLRIRAQTLATWWWRWERLRHPHRTRARRQVAEIHRTWQEGYAAGRAAGRREGYRRALERLRGMLRR